MPSNREWGPFLWTILHGLAERLGRQPNELMASDEAREMVLVLKGVELIMPCEKCRAHFHDYRMKHPIDGFSSKRGEHLRFTIREWLWRLHELVNERNGAAPFSIENLTPTYQNANVEDAWKNLQTYLKTSVTSGIVLSENLKSFRRHLGFLRSLLGI